jgi:predicted MFS family arabinose efflux permease
MKIPTLLMPIRRSTFRWLWVGMGLSYAGDRLQEMAQAWLVAGLSQSSALAVGGIGFLASLPQLLMPLGGAVADRLNRYKLMIVCQIVGAAAAAGIGLMVFNGSIKIWHIYVWALLAGTIWLVSRPAFKVVLTESVPKEEVRAAVGLNSITETLAIVLVSGGGSLLLQRAGLPLAFLLNALSYGFAGFCLYMLYRSIRTPVNQTSGFQSRAILNDLLDGIAYLVRKPYLFFPLLITLFIVGLTGPASSLLAAVIHKQGGTIVSLGMLGVAGSLGSFCGAIYAGSNADSHNPTRQYAFWGCVGAGAIILFAFLPVGIMSALPLAAIGFILFSQAVWNTSRVRLVADPAYQARLQALTTMSFTMGGALGQVWGGVSVDRFGMLAFAGGGVVLLFISIGFLIISHRTTTGLDLSKEEIHG